MRLGLKFGNWVSLHHLLLLLIAVIFFIITIKNPKFDRLLNELLEFSPELGGNPLSRFVPLNNLTHPPSFLAPSRHHWGLWIKAYQQTIAKMHLFRLT